jgi:hypothetical protein
VRKIPASLPGLMEYVAVDVYGPIGWRYRVAQGLGVAKSTLFRYLAGERGSAIAEETLLALIERERDATVTRRAALRDLHDEVATAIQKKAKQVRDAA